MARISELYLNDERLDLLSGGLEVARDNRDWVIVATTAVPWRGDREDLNVRAVTSARTFTGLGAIADMTFDSRRPGAFVLTLVRTGG